MKPKIPLVLIAISQFFARTIFAQDRFGASEEELAVLQALNRSNTVITQSDEEITKLMVGKWATPRHDYIYRANGTWQMLPIDRDTPHGSWRIENHQLIQAGAGHSDASAFLLVTKNYLVLKNDQGTYPFRYLRIR
jgi:hypothetical protein